MNIFKIWKRYRDFGLSYGLPAYYIDCGPGVSYDPLEVVKKLVSEGLKKESLVVIRDGMRERGVGTLVSCLSQMGVKVEVEADGKDVTPGWFPQVYRWIVRYVKNNVFNYGALRRGQDMLIYQGGSIEDFLDTTKNFQSLRVVVVEDKDGIWDKVKNENVRVYESKSSKGN